MTRPLFHLIFALAVFAATLAGYAFWYHQLGVVSAEAASLSAKAALNEEGSAHATAAAKELESEQGTKDAIRSYYVAPNDVVPFLEALESKGTALRAEVNVASVTAQPSGIPHLDLALSAKGSFSAVLATAGAIEYAPYDIRAHSLTLSLDGDATTTWTGTMTLSVATASTTP